MDMGLCAAKNSKFKEINPRLHHTTGDVFQIEQNKKSRFQTRAAFY